MTRLLFLTLLLCSAAAAFGAENHADEPLDRVTVRLGDGSGRTIRGRIQSITGVGGVAIISAEDKSESFPMSQVLDLKTVRTPSHAAGDAALAEGLAAQNQEKLAEALSLFRTARKSEEERYWMKQLLTARIVETLAALGESGEAAEEFFLLCQTDPFTPYLSSIPLGGENPARTPGLSSDPATLAAWLDDRKNPTGVLNPAGKLLAAALLLSGPFRREARAALDELVTLRSPLPENVDATEHCRAVSLLASAQLWRLKLAAGPKPEEAALWRRALSRFPPTLAAGPTRIVALAFERLGDSETAEELRLQAEICVPRN